MNNFLLAYSAIPNYGFTNTLYFLSDNNIDIEKINTQNEYAVLIPYDFKNIIEPKCFLPQSNCTTPQIFPILKKIPFQKMDEVKDLLSDFVTIESSKNKAILESVSYDDYKKKFQTIQDYLKNGDIYEINYCIPFIFKNISIHPIEIFCNLIYQMNAPFTAFFKCNDEYILSFSPERFLKKEKDYLFTEPIKGTAPRSANPIEDNNNKLSLQNSPKERTENAMIVDVCRNDLSRIAQKSSVKVEELFSIKTYATVHQMVSKISCKLKNNISFKDIIYASFPMASMTGAPKIRAMQISDEIELLPRNYYSGCLGIYEKGNFDLSVLIRSVFYNHHKKELKIWAGSAITIYANPQNEFEECNLKAHKLLQVLKNNILNSKSMT